MATPTSYHSLVSRMLTHIVRGGGSIETSVHGIAVIGTPEQAEGAYEVAYHTTDAGLLCRERKDKYGRVLSRAVFSNVTKAWREA